MIIKVLPVVLLSLFACNLLADTECIDSLKKQPELIKSSTVVAMIHSSNLAKVRPLFTHADKINKLGLEGHTPLTWAAYIGSLTAVKHLINWGADPNITDQNEVTPLMYASGAGKTNVKIVSKLLEAGADPNAQELSYGHTALMFAAMDIKNNPRIIHKLLKAGADPNILDKHKRNALMYAVGYNKRLSSILLVNAGTDIDSMDEAGRTAITTLKDLSRRSTIIENYLLGRKLKLNYHEMKKELSSDR